MGRLFSQALGVVYPNMGGLFVDYVQDVYMCLILYMLLMWVCVGSYMGGCMVGVSDGVCMCVRMYVLVGLCVYEALYVVCVRIICNVCIRNMRMCANTACILGGTLS